MGHERSGQTREDVNAGERGVKMTRVLLSDLILSDLMEKVKKLSGDVELGIVGAETKLYEALEELERRILFIERAVIGK